MITEADLAFGRRLIYDGREGEVIDILRRPGRPTRVQLRFAAPTWPRVRWVSIAKLEDPHATP